MAAPEEANPEHPDIKYFRDQMTLEVKAACEGAIAAGAKDIYVKDAHWTGRNIDPRRLPKIVKIIRGWTGHPFSMMAELDRSFDAVCYVGYHDRAGSGGNPLAHTFSGRVVAEMRVNSNPVSEYHINTFLASSLGVPVAFLSGDRRLCEAAKAQNARLEVYSTMEGIGAGTISVHPDVAIDGIREGVRRALSCDLTLLPQAASSKYTIAIDYKQPSAAYRNSFYPGVELVSERTLSFTSSDFQDVMTMIHFCVR